MASIIPEIINPSFEGKSELRRRSSYARDANGSTKPGANTSSMVVLVPKKYCHIAAVHVQQRTSCLSHDAYVNPSFLGFRNLMVLVLSKSSTVTD